MNGALVALVIWALWGLVLASAFLHTAPKSPVADEARRTQAAVRQINRRAREDMLRLASQRQADRPVGRATVPAEYIDAESYWS